ncbi:MAG: MATE family efflux transporter, partial [Tepidisphaeraceae bacterium]
MSQVVPASADTLETQPSPESPRRLLKLLGAMSMPVLAENLLHMLVGLNDTYLANHVVLLSPTMPPEQVAAARTEMAAAAAAVGSVMYFMWLIGLIAGAVGTGSTAIIARATGARHRGLANSVCGQSIVLAFICGIAVGLFMFVFAKPLADVTLLQGRAHDFSLLYLRMLSIAVPFMIVMMIANACLRGAGDTLTPAVVFIIVDIVNVILSFALTYGWGPLPKLGFEGIALGTVIAYVTGGVIQIAVLLHGRGGIRLFLHRLRPHWYDMKRLLRIGIPSGMEGLLQWGANFGVVAVVNRMDATNVSAAAHLNSIRIEAVSYLAGFGVATAAATMVGQSLGMGDPRRATRAAWMAYLLGGTMMLVCGVAFIALGSPLARILSGDPRVIELTRQCLFITGFVQAFFALGIIFGGALRGAGDT